MSVHVLAYKTDNPGDTADLKRKISEFPADSIRRIALLVKTEGNSDVNDYSREYGLLSSTLVLKDHGGQELVDRTTFLFSMGCEGAMTPFGYMFVDMEDGDAAKAGSREALVLGQARSRPLLPNEIGRPDHVDIVAQTVRAAMGDAGVDVKDVALVIVKTPVVSFTDGTAPEGNGRITSAQSKAVGALGAGVALGEVDRSRIEQGVFGKDASLHARRAIVFSGAEIDCVEVLLLANKQGAAGDLYIHTGYLDDLLDAAGVRRTLAEAGCRVKDGVVEDADRIAALLLKVGIDADGKLRGNRTTILTSHLDMDLHLRATMSGIVGSIVGHTNTFISANTVHQAPPGGGICACIVRHSATQ